MEAVTVIYSHTLCAASIVRMRVCTVGRGISYWELWTMGCCSYSLWFIQNHFCSSLQGDWQAASQYLHVPSWRQLSFEHRHILHWATNSSIRLNDSIVTLFYNSTSSSSVALQSLKDLGRLTYGRFLDLLRHSGGLLWWVISLSQRPLLTQSNTTHKDEDKHPCLKQDLDPRSQRPSDQGLRLRRHGHWGRFCSTLRGNKKIKGKSATCHLLDKHFTLFDVPKCIYYQHDQTQDPEWRKLLKRQNVTLLVS
jgi:hypothetical protein